MKTTRATNVRTCAFVAALLSGSARAADPAPITVGLVGLDTTHAVQFTQLLNDPQSPHYVPGARVLAAFKGGSPDIPDSVARIDQFTAELVGKWNVRLVGSVEELVAAVDAVIITSLDGRTHLAQARPVFKARKRVFIDKPLGGNWEEAQEIWRLSRVSGTPFFSASALRYAPEIQALRHDAKLGGPVVGAFTYGPAPIEPHHPDLFWYGVHAVEMLYTLMGPGCTSVSRTYTDGADVVVGRWKDGRTGTMRGVRDGAKTYGAVAFGKAGVALVEPGKISYRELMREIVHFFATGVSPVPPEETIETMAFMQAADTSRARAGAATPLSFGARGK